MSLDGQIAVVTGGASGIGRASAIRLAEDGADVAILDVDGDGLREAARRISRIGRRSLAIEVDLMDRDATADAFSTVEEQLGAVGVLHNNAGGSLRGQRRPFVESTIDQWDRILDLNLSAVARCTKHVVAAMIERGSGRIINTSSERAFHGGAGFTDYAAAKAGLLGFTRSLALELGPHGITVNAVCPGATLTAAFSRLSEDDLERTRAQIPVGRIAEPDDIAHAVSFLASPGAWYVNGESLLVTGGRTLH